MSGAGEVRCRGLRKWCARRCEVRSSLAPPGYPATGFFCAQHRYQEPRAAPAGEGGGSLPLLRFDCAAVEEHLRRRTSWVAPEAATVGEMLRAPGLVRDGKTASGAAILAWLRDKRGADEAAALAYAQRMLDAGALAPRDGADAPGARFTAERGAVYRVGAAAPPTRA